MYSKQRTKNKKEETTSGVAIGGDGGGDGQAVNVAGDAAALLLVTALVMPLQIRQTQRSCLSSVV